jgi:hypothetical protein
MDPIDRAMASAEQELQRMQTDHTLAADVTAGLIKKFGASGMRFARPLHAGLDAPVCSRCMRTDNWFQWADSAELICACDAGSWPTGSEDRAFEVYHALNALDLLDRSHRCLAQMDKWQATSRARIRRTRHQLHSTAQCLAGSRQLLADGSDRVSRASRGMDK